MQKNCDLDYTLKSRKSVFGQLFFSLFSTLIFFGFYVFFQFFFMYFITSKIIFSKFGMYLTYKNRFWVHFSWFLGRDINSTVWTRNGSKIKKRVMVFKGLNQISFCAPCTMSEKNLNKNAAVFMSSFFPCIASSDKFTRMLSWMNV